MLLTEKCRHLHKILSPLLGFRRLMFQLFHAPLRWWFAILSTPKLRNHSRNTKTWFCRVPPRESKFLLCDNQSQHPNIRFKTFKDYLGFGRYLHNCLFAPHRVRRSAWQTLIFRRFIVAVVVMWSTAVVLYRRARWRTGRNRSATPSSTVEWLQL